MNKHIDNEENKIAEQLMTPEGKIALRKVMFHGHPDLQTAFIKYYIPRLLAQHMGWEIIDGGKNGK